MKPHPYPGTIEYAIWAYKEEMRKAEAEKARKALTNALA